MIHSFVFRIPSFHLSKWVFPAFGSTPPRHLNFRIFFKPSSFQSVFSSYLFIQRRIYPLIINLFKQKHCVKSVRIRSYPGPYFPTFGLNAERHGVSLCIQSECGKIQTWITPNTDTFYVVKESDNSTIGYPIRFVNINSTG